MISRDSPYYGIPCSLSPIPSYYYHTSSPFYSLSCLNLVVFATFQASRLYFSQGNMRSEPFLRPEFDAAPQGVCHVSSETVSCHSISRYNWPTTYADILPRPGHLVFHLPRPYDLPSYNSTLGELDGFGEPMAPCRRGGLGFGIRSRQFHPFTHGPKEDGYLREACANVLARTWVPPLELLVSSLHAAFMIIHKRSYHETMRLRL